jgi:hypothetical protein
MVFLAGRAEETPAICFTEQVRIMSRETAKRLQCTYTVAHGAVTIVVLTEVTGAVLDYRVVATIVRSTYPVAILHTGLIVITKTTGEIAILNAVT